MNATLVDRLVTQILFVADHVVVVLYTAVELNPVPLPATYPFQPEDDTCIAYCVQYGFEPGYIDTVMLVTHILLTEGAGGTAASVTVEPRLTQLLGTPE